MELPVINLTYELYKSITEINHDLAKKWRFSLGISLENSILNLLEQLIMAKYAPKPMKNSYLIHANALLEITRLKCRLFLELKLINETKIFQMQKRIEEIGKMLGGWMKAIHSQ